ncbi:hypothetical protein F2Q69_00033705 [Brassica cretica]|uniref:Uncharacterized protein n=1 Tax=Brassica cretica TaxID=69181 RepID=A0A8S9SM70_BRACR|nr:hypothetical protein F2Q69_00033705 [Brassica cretica]
MSWQHHLLLLIRLYDLLRRGKRSPNFPQQNWFIAFLFLMALGFFCLALFLYLSLDPDSGYTSASVATFRLSSSPNRHPGVCHSTFESLRLGRSSQSIASGFLHFWDSLNFKKDMDFVGITVLLHDEKIL